MFVLVLNEAGMWVSEWFMNFCGFIYGDFTEGIIICVGRKLYILYQGDRHDTPTNHFGISTSLNNQ